MSKNLQIQAMRGIFCIIIVVYHFAVRYPELYEVDTFLSSFDMSFLALIGVSGFFILTGYYLNSNKKITNKGLIVYYLKRILNLWLNYCFAIVIIYLVSLCGKLGVERSPNFLDLIKNIFLLNFIGGKYVDGAHWYVITIIIMNIYFLILSLLHIESKKYTYYAYLLFSIIISILNLNYSEVLFIKGINKLFLCNYLPQMIIGIALFNILKADKKDLNWIIIGVLSLLNMCIININYLAILPILTILIYFALIGRFKFLEKIRPLIIIGNASFSIYLMHQYIGYILLNSININYHFSLFLVIIIMIFVGLLFYYILEKNIKKLVNDLYSRIEERIS